MGKGGMGKLYYGFDKTLHRPVALKLPKFPCKSEPINAARLESSSVVHIYEVGKVRNTHYYAQELIYGRNIQEVVDDLGRIPERVALDIVLQIAHVLEKCEEAKISHRDLSSRNIMLINGYRGAEVKVIDFGLSKKAHTRYFKRSHKEHLNWCVPWFTCPEGIHTPSNRDGSGDRYSLGRLLILCLMGHKYGSEYQHKTPTRKELDKVCSPEVQGLLYEMVAKDRNLRIASAKSIVERIKGCLAKQKTAGNTFETQYQENLRRYLQKAEEEKQKKVEELQSLLNLNEEAKEGVGPPFAPSPI